MKYIFSGAIGLSTGKGVSYSLLEETDSVFSWIAALEEEDNTGQPINRYRVDIDKVSRNVQTPRLINLSEAELKEVVLAATDHHLQASSGFIDGALSISYKVVIEEDLDIQNVVQLRHHGNFTSMTLLMSLISSTVRPEHSASSCCIYYPRRRATAEDHRIW